MIVALAGRRTDEVNSDVARFPLQNVEAVRERLRTLFVDRRASVLVASGACGADIVAHEVARTLGMLRILVLPFPPMLFRELSVTDRPGEWGPAFDTLVADARLSGDSQLIVEASSNESPNAAFARANELIIDRALSLAARTAGENVLAVVVWEGAIRGKDDLSAAFEAYAQRRRVETISVSTLP